MLEFLKDGYPCHCPIHYDFDRTRVYGGHTDTCDGNTSFRMNYDTEIAPPFHHDVLARKKHEDEDVFHALSKMKEERLLIHRQSNVIKPLSSGLVSKLKLLIEQLRLAKRNAETPPIKTASFYIEGERVLYDHDGLIQQLSAMIEGKKALDPFCLYVAYGYIEQWYIESEHIEGKKENVEDICRELPLTDNPVVLHALFNLMVQVSGLKCYINSGVGNLILAAETKYLKPTNTEMPVISVLQYQQAPESLWPIKSYLPDWDPDYRIAARQVKESESSNREVGNYILMGRFKYLISKSKYRYKEMKENEEWEFNSHQQENEFSYVVESAINMLCARISTDKPCMHFKDIYTDYNGVKKVNYPIFNEEMSYSIERSGLSYAYHQRVLGELVFFSEINCDSKLKKAFISAVRSFQNKILKNDLWFKERKGQFQYYYTWLFKSYMALDTFITTYETLKQKESFFGKHLPMEPLNGLKAIRDHYYDKITLLTQIKLNHGWQKVVESGQRFDLDSIFGEAMKSLPSQPEYKMMRNLFRSDEWRFYQAKIANAVLYFKTHPEKLVEEEMEVLFQFAQHLLKDKSAFLQKEARQQMMVLGIIFTLAIGAAVSLSLPGGPITHLTLGAAEAAVVTEFVVGFLHLSHGFHEIFEKLKSVNLDLKEADLLSLREELRALLTNKSLPKKGLKKEGGVLSRSKQTLFAANEPAKKGGVMSLSGEFDSSQKIASTP